MVVVWGIVGELDNASLSIPHIRNEPSPPGRSTCRPPIGTGGCASSPWDQVRVPCQRLGPWIRLQRKPSYRPPRSFFLRGSMFVESGIQDGGHWKSCLTDRVDPPEKNTNIANLAFRTRDSIGFVSKFCVMHLVVFMCPNLNFGVGSSKKQLWEKPSKEKV